MFETALLASIVAEAVATWTTLATLRTRTTLRTVATRTAFALYIAFWLGQKHLARELILACLRIYLHQFNLYLVAFLKSCLFNSFKTLPVYL